MSPTTSLRVGSVLAGVLLLATACGSAGGSTASGSSTSGQSSTSGRQGGYGQRVRPGASGAVVDVSGKTAQVQSEQNGQASGQTAVTWTASTTFTRQVAATVADAVVGSCVVVTSSTASTTGTTGTTPSTLAASTIRISSAANGSCSLGAGRGGPGRGPGGSASERPSGAPSGRPSGMPSGMPSGGPRGQLGQVVFGTVTAVGSGSLTVAATGFGSSSTTDVSVTTSSSTSVTKTAAATSAAVKVGACVTAQGTTDSSGNVTARTIAVSAKTDGTCSSGMGGMRMPGGGSSAGPA